MPFILSPYSPSCLHPKIWTSQQNRLSSQPKACDIAVHLFFPFCLYLLLLLYENLLFVNQLELEWE